MRVLGLWGAPQPVCAQLFASIELEGGTSQDFHRISRSGVAALVRTGTPGLSVAEAFDGFAIVDGDLFEPTGPGDASPAARVLDLFRRHGTEALDRLEGNAFIAVWDARSGRLVLARDRFGLGLGYWMEQGGWLLWSSELTTLLGCDERTGLDLKAVDQFLADGRVSAPWTTLAHIRKIPAAHTLEADRGGIRTRRYWRQDGRHRLRLRHAERLERMESALLTAHRRQITPGRPAAALLSGGVDSMLMVALLARLGCASETFTYRYTHYEGVFNEGAAAARAAAWVGLRHQEMPVGPEDIRKNFAEILWRHQGPVTYGLHSALLSAVTASSAPILYSGQGNGGPSLAEQIGLALSRSPRLGRALAALGHLPGAHSGPLADLAYIGRVAETRLSWRFHSPLTDPVMRSVLYADAGWLAAAVAEREQYYAQVIREFDNEGAQNAFCASIQRLGTADGTLHWTASFARAHGLLARCPYYDRDLIELTYRLPRERDKRDLRLIAAKYLPRDLAFAPKIGQTIPISPWLRGPLAQWLGEWLDPDRVRGSGMFHPGVVQKLYRSHLAGGDRYGWTLWSIAAMVAWREMIDRQAGRYTGRAMALSAAG